MLGVKPNQPDAGLVSGEFPDDPSQVAVPTRSMLQITVEIAAVIGIPEMDNHRVFDAQAIDSGPQLIKIVSGPDRPGGAFVAVRYAGHWYWIDDRDIRSKSLFSFVILLLSLSDSAAKSNMLMVTIPSN